MKIKLAAPTLNEEPKSIDYKELLSILSEKKVAFLHRETDKSVFSKLEKDFERIIACQVRYGLADDELVYEVQIIA